MKVLFFLLFSFTCFSQGVIINEVSNGTGGTKEFVELLVVGSNSSPTGLVDLTHWVIDDNNGDFEASIGTGVAAGHYRFTSLFPSVPTGSLIVIYNTSDINLNMLPDDPTDINNDSIYIIPINSIYLERCTSLPSSTLGTSYTPCTYTSSITQTWNIIGLRNRGDVIQVRKPDYSFYHGFSYGDVGNPFPNFPIEFNSKPSFKVKPNTGRRKCYFLDCPDWTEKSNYIKGPAIDDTPGVANTINNQILINNIKDGTFDYTDFSNINNCDPLILDESSINITTEYINDNILIKWNSNIEYYKYELYKSNNGYLFNLLKTTNQLNYIDSLPNEDNYYKLIGYNLNDSLTTNIVYQEGNKHNIKIYPNPVYNKLNIITNNYNGTLYIYDIIGNLIFESKLKRSIDINIPNGNYILKIKTNNFIITKKIIKIQNK